MFSFTRAENCPDIVKLLASPEHLMLKEFIIKTLNDGLTTENCYIHNELDALKRNYRCPEMSDDAFYGFFGALLLPVVPELQAQMNINDVSFAPYWDTDCAKIRGKRHIVTFFYSKDDDLLHIVVGLPSMELADHLLLTKSKYFPLKKPATEMKKPESDKRIDLDAMKATIQQKLQGNGALVERECSDGFRAEIRIFTWNEREMQTIDPKYTAHPPAKALEMADKEKNLPLFRAILFAEHETERTNCLVGFIRRTVKSGTHVWNYLEEACNPICCFCGNECEDKHGNNPFPSTVSGRCCDNCNASVVLPARFNGLFKSLAKKMEEDEAEKPKKKTKAQKKAEKKAERDEKERTARIEFEKADTDCEWEDMMVILCDVGIECIADHVVQCGNVFTWNFEDETKIDRSNEHYILTEHYIIALRDMVAKKRAELNQK
jgi:hypothetical protein